MNVSAADTASDAFGLLIAPISTGAFFERYFESRELHVARNAPAYFAGLYGVGCVEDALVIGANEPGQFALIKHDALTVPLADMVSERSPIRARSARRPVRSILDSRNVLAAFAAGYTLNIKDAGAYHPPLARLCNRLQTQLGFYAQANAYFTPPGARGFATHYDTHDTLVLQIEGHKNWLVYDAIIPLPLEGQPFSQSAHEGRLGKPREIRLGAGDTLYIPHGFPHTAMTALQRSLHVTLAISPIRVIDLLDSLVQLAARNDVELRRALPPGWHRDPTFGSRLSARLAERLPRMIASDHIQLATELVFNELFGASGATSADTFDALAALEGLRPATRIGLRDDAPFELRERDDQLDIVLPAKVVSVPAAALAGFARLQAGPATYAELAAMLPVGSAGNFVRLLVLEGLVLIDG